VHCILHLACALQTTVHWLAAVHGVGKDVQAPAAYRPTSGGKNTCMTYVLHPGCHPTKRSRLSCMCMHCKLCTSCLVRWALVVTTGTCSCGQAHPTTMTPLPCDTHCLMRHSNTCRHKCTPSTTGRHGGRSLYKPIWASGQTCCWILPSHRLSTHMEQPQVFLSTASQP
jgi:hypothetical protein